MPKINVLQSHWVGYLELLVIEGLPMLHDKLGNRRVGPFWHGRIRAVDQIQVAVITKGICIRGVVDRR